MAAIAAAARAVAAQRQAESHGPWRRSKRAGTSCWNCRFAQPLGFEGL